MRGLDRVPFPFHVLFSAVLADLPIGLEQRTLNHRADYAPHQTAKYWLLTHAAQTIEWQSYYAPLECWQNADHLQLGHRPARKADLRSRVQARALPNQMHPHCADTRYGWVRFPHKQFQGRQIECAHPPAGRRAVRKRFQYRPHRIQRVRGL